MQEKEAEALVDQATIAANAETLNGQRASFWDSWKANLEKLGILLVEDTESLTQLDTLPWDEPTYAPPYVVCEKWEHTFFRTTFANTRFVLDVRDHDRPVFLVAQLAASRFLWTDLGTDAKEDLLAALKRKTDNRRFQDFAGMLVTDVLPEWAQQP